MEKKGNTERCLTLPLSLGGRHKTGESKGREMRRGSPKDSERKTRGGGKKEMSVRKGKEYIARLRPPGDCPSLLGSCSGSIQLGKGSTYSGTRAGKFGIENSCRRGD